MVLVDTSIWISLYRKRESELSFVLQRLVINNRAAICGPIWVEFIGGFRNAAQRKKYSDKLAVFPFIDADRADFVSAAEIAASSAQVGPGDALIAAIAVNHNCSLLTADRDFHRLRSFGLKLFQI